MQHLVYLHGFLSSPQSLKAQQTKQYIKQYLPSLSMHMPQLSGDINKSLSTIDALLATLPKNQIGFIGSSMGGFLATYCVEKHGGKAVLINPAVDPQHLFSDYLGLHINPNTNEKFCITKQHLTTLHNIATQQLRDPKKYLVLLQTDDETLDYRLAEKKYQDSHLLIQEGGNHSFVDYDKCLPTILQFLR